MIVFFLKLNGTLQFLDINPCARIDREKLVHYIVTGQILYKQLRLFNFFILA